MNQEDFFKPAEDQGLRDEMELAGICNAIIDYLQRRPDGQSKLIGAINHGIERKIASVELKANLCGLLLAGISEREVERLKKKGWWPVDLNTEK